MGDATNNGATRVAPAVVRTPRPVALKVQQEIKSAVHQGLIKRLDLEKIALMHENPASQQQLGTVIQQLIGEQNIPLSATERDRLAQEVLDEVFGLGPLEPLLQDPSVNDILVNTYNTVYVERHGVLEKTAIIFKDDGHLMQVIDKIVSAVGRRVDESSPMVDARLKDGSRVNVIIPPLAVDGPILSIRKFASKPLMAEDLLRNKALTEPMLETLKAAVQTRLNIVVSGGTGAGKTTLLNVLSGFIDERERIVTIEDSAELQVKHTHVVRLECRPPNVEGKGAVRQRELVINALRMRPDRIVLGEVRGEECMDMLQAMNTGHDGSLTTVHANTPRDAVARMETMAMMGDVNLPEKAIRAQIASAVHLIVQIARMSDGSRRVTHIAELTGAFSDVISMQDVFVFERVGLGPTGKVKGRFRGTGIVPKFAEKSKAAGFPLPSSLLDYSMEV
ncbi:MAG TPA: CpaF family protein [Acidobacteriaceae bacterium]|nr:CpaF family protein [Acidobacteriaceae bacterium]